ncbi:ogr/Delta-like zinc finger family protein [Avibacterium paragallinarum]|uniref:ogr/Delta-like zinc finger family protein n=1 Tax=Avibacterium paragallinarum TaxID=728 RepID=UPI00021ACE4C|nr:ogr/Delta-like zinc finger family protein [Avibacterium paragallinarum]QIR10948.1 transcriptional regulator [Avibacterium paragallinarum]QLD64061.1 ogr/Delta-like zinc finger family protein [Avibacterium paragallinarum]
MARNPRIYCNVCKSKARIEKTEHLNENFNKLYCSCCNPECNHHFVFNQEFSHTTKTSLLIKDSLLTHILGLISEQDKEKIKRAL